MDQFFAWMVANQPGISILGQILFVGVIFLLSICWIFGLGRFKRDAGSTRPKAVDLRYLITEALTKIINDFRHLLALILVVIFGGALTYTLIQAGGNMVSIKEALQAVTSTLGGLVGSIIGYYFGESKGRQNASDAAPDVIEPQEVQPPEVDAPAAGTITATERPQ